MALQDPNIMPSSRLDCPLSLKTPNMGNTGLEIMALSEVIADPIHRSRMNRQGTEEKAKKENQNEN